MVKCVGGGWLVPGRPTICHGVATKFSSPNDAHRSALSAGWTYDGRDQKHRCPQHQTGSGHTHYFKLVGSYPTGPESTGTLRVCACGEQIEEDTDD